MQVPVKWLKEYVNLDGISIEALEERLIMTGSNTEYVERTLGKAEGLMMGKVKSIEPHPDADKLVVCQIEMGEEILQIVTGATNVEIGKNLVVAVHGSTIGDGTKIKKGKLRGVVSNGMLCSLDEMGFEDKVVPKAYSDGIFLFSDEYESGKLATEVFSELSDEVILFEITPNRPDCLSVMGIAREASASFEREMKPFEVNVDTLPNTNASDDISISIDCPDICPRYIGRVIKNVKIGESPDWMKFRLMKAGMRPINNIVDISNYVMLELGQPTHAFDLDTLKGGKINVRASFDNEIMTTLDGVDRKLPRNTIVIADGERAVAIGGIMGGEETEVRDNTKSILIEAACFDKANIRRCSRELGLRSEASSRFEKGVNPELSEAAVNRVCQLIQELGAGEIVGGMVDVYPNKYTPIEIKVSTKWVNNYIGIDISREQMMEILKGLFFEVKALEDGDTLSVIAPYYRLDIEKPIDLVEEIARIYGYDKIPVTIPKGKDYGAKTHNQILEDKIRTNLISQGLYETLTYSFVSPSALDKVKMPNDSELRDQIRLMNPLGEEYSVMRTSLIPNAMEILARNYKFKNENAGIFEIGNAFFKDPEAPESAKEKKKLVIAAYGKNEDFFGIKGIIEKLVAMLSIKGLQLYSNTENPTFHPGRCADIYLGEDIIGVAGEVHPLVCEDYDIGTRCYCAELDFDRLLKEAKLDRQFKHLPKFPAISRDIAVISDEDLTHAQVLKFINKYGGRDLVDVKLFDVYKGKQIEDGKKSMAYSLLYRSNDRTLTDEEINLQFDNMVEKLSLLGATLR